MISIYQLHNKHFKDISEYIYLYKFMLCFGSLYENFVELPKERIETIQLFLIKIS